MSVLFNALHRAAQADVGMVSPARWTASPALAPSRPWRSGTLGWVVFLGFSAAVLGAIIWLTWRELDVLATPPTTASVFAPAPVEVVASVADSSDAPVPSAALDDGIALSASALNEPLPPITPAPAQIAAVAASLSPLPEVAEAAPLAETSPTLLPAGPQIYASRGTAPRSAALARAQSLLTRGDLTAALKIYDDLLRRQGDDSAALAGKALTLQQAGDAAGAVPLWRRAVAVAPADPAVRAGLATALGQLDAPQAVLDLETMIAAQPQFAPLHAARAQQLSRQGDADAALAAMERAWALDRANVVYRLNLAILADQRGAMDQALTLYRQALAARDTTTVPLDWDGVRARIQFLSGVR